MDLEHPFLATGIGSFPHQDENAVFDLILGNFPEIPFLPQLPKRSFLEGIPLQFSEGFPSLRWSEKGQRIWVDTAEGFDREVERFYEAVEGRQLDRFEITEGFSKGLRLLPRVASLEKRGGAHYIKGQITGPITLGLFLVDHEKRPIFYEPTLRDILLKHLSCKARWMEKHFHDLLPRTETMVIFDEPSLSTFGSAFSGLNREDVTSSLNECFSAVQGLVGVHCCGNTDWGLILETRLDILSFDAYGYLETLALYPKPLRAFLERGGILAWGIVPTGQEIEKEDASTLTLRLKKGLDLLVKEGIDPALLRRAILTPSCGVASLSVPLAERVCRVTSELSRRAREEKIVE